MVEKLTLDAAKKDPSQGFIASHYLPKEGSYIGVNCYEYAISGKNYQLRDPLVANPGESVGDFTFFSDNKERTMLTSENVIAGAEIDGLEKAGKTGDITIPPEKPDHYRVAVYVDEHHDYHWVREDFDKNGKATGEWKGKFGQSGIHLVSEDSTQAVSSKTPPATLYDNYKFAQYFYVPNEGKNVGADAYIEKMAQKDIVQARADHKIISDALNANDTAEAKSARIPEDPQLSNRSSRINYELSLNPVTKMILQQPTTASEMLQHHIPEQVQKMADLAALPLLDLIERTDYSQTSTAKPAQQAPKGRSV